MRPVSAPPSPLARRRERLTVRGRVALVVTALLAALAPLGLVTPASAADGQGSVIGRVVDEAGDPVSAEVTAYNEETEEGESTTVEPDGRFTLDLVPGTHYVNVSDVTGDLASQGFEVDVAEDETSDLGDIVLVPPRPDADHGAVRGTVRSAAGQPVPGAEITVTLDDGAQTEAYTRDDGTFVVVLEPGTYQLDFSDPDGRLASRRVQVSSTANTWTEAGTVTLQPMAASTTFGRVAGQSLAYCGTNVLRRNDDESSGAVDVPFPLRFFGNPYDQLFVNNNGNVTFSEPLSEFTPSDLTTSTSVPIIAPFFADVDTRALSSRVVTYGASPDGRTLCVQWSDVGYYHRHSDKTNTFQLLLTSNQTASGRTAGDFDITFNYDQLTWEAGDASDGTDGLGGVTAAVGYSAGTGEPGTFFQVDGSLTPGALLDGGPKALVRSSLSSAQRGRYIFEVRNENHDATLGGLHGKVTRTGGANVGGAWVEACSSSSVCDSTQTREDGTYSFPAVREGAVRVSVSPPDHLRGAGSTVQVQAGQVTTADYVLAAPTAQPAAASITQIDRTEDGVPVVRWDVPLQLTYTGCSGTGATYTITSETGDVLRTGALTQGPTGTFGATVAALAPYTGAARVTTSGLTCGTATPFDLYIDPSGNVHDQWGTPLAGVTATLSRADSQNGTYEVLADGSTLMSPSNRSNPSTTDGDGFFRWDVLDGWYKVAFTRAGCTPTSTAAMEVPPERVGLQITMTCNVPPPATSAQVSGSSQVGGTLTGGQTLASGMVVTARRWLRDGQPIAGATGATYRPTAADAGRGLSLEVTAARPGYAAVVTRSASVAVPRLGSGTAVSAVGKKKRKATVTVVVTVPGLAAPGGTVVIKDGRRVVASRALPANGRIVLKLKKLKKGRHTFTASYSGTSAVNGSAGSAKAKVKK